MNLRQEVKIEPRIPGLDRLIIHSVNSLGFRGPEPPANMDERYTVFVVGGSTTECSKLSDGKTGSAVLDWAGVWRRMIPTFGSIMLGSMAALRT